MKIKFALFVLLCAAGAFVLPANEVKLMFGGQQVPLRKEQSKFLDFRYISQADPMFSAPPKKLQGWNWNPKGGAAYAGFSSGTMPADVLLEHGIACRQGKLTVPYAPKEAVVRIWVGDWFAGHRRLYGRDHKIFLKVNGTTVYSTVMTVENTFKEWCMLEEYVFSRHHSIWDRIVKPILKEYTVKVNNPAGKITLEMNNLLLTALAIAPDQKSIDKIAAQVEAERRAQFAVRYPWKPQPDDPMPPLNGAQEMLLFQKSGLDNIHPWSRPGAHEITRTIRAFAARGEQEMLRFGILPLRDLKDFYVEIGDFKCGKNIISVKENADLWRERYKERGSEGTRGVIDALWRLNPLSYVFQENKRFFAEKGTPRMFSLDVKVPENAPAGNYYAPLTISSGKKVICKAQFCLSILHTIRQPLTTSRVLPAFSGPPGIRESTRKQSGRKLKSVSALWINTVSTVPTSTPGDTDSPAFSDSARWWANPVKDSSSSIRNMKPTGIGGLPMCAATVKMTLP